MILSGKPCSFYTLFLNSLANSSAIIFSVVGIKWTIFVSLSTTTRIESYPCAKSSLVIKSADIYVQGFSGIEFGINFPTSYSVWFLLCWQTLHPSTYLFTFLVTPDHQKFQVTSSTVFHCSPCPPTGISWYSLTISILSSLSLGTYTFPFLYIILLISLYSSFLSIFTFTCCYAASKFSVEDNIWYALYQWILN